MPVEVVEIGTNPSDWLTEALSLANSVQNEFTYTRLRQEDALRFQMHAYDSITATEIMDSVEAIRTDIRGYHPYLIAFVDAYLDGRSFSNLFGSCRAEAGLGIVTTANVPGIIVAPEKMASYFLYYLSRYTLGYVVPRHKNHDDSRGCVYDRKIDKRDLLKSMRARSLCDGCRKALLSGRTALSSQQLAALSRMFDTCGQVLDGSVELPQESRPVRRAFIGSSVEGLDIANRIQALLEYDIDTDVWNQGTVFQLGDATLEALERAVECYDFGIFVFTPDDETHSRGEFKPVARDNVVLELGLFIGKLTRARAFIVHPSKRAIALPSDLLGITTATYDPDKPNLASTLGPACNRIRETIKRELV